MGAQAPGGGLLLHGATRDAIVDNVLAALDDYFKKSLKSESITT
jgi:hypothetical protein